MKPVKTVNETDLRELATKLMSLAVDDGFEADCVVAIASGGVHVVNAMAVSPNVTKLTVESRRPSSVKKRNRWKQLLVRALPYRLSNQIRRAEDWWLARQPVAERSTSPEITSTIRTAASEIVDRGHRRLLIVDDAVDSGVTLRNVADEFEASLPASVAVRTAVIVHTRPRAQLARAADYALFEGTLLRFPWSADYRGFP